MMRAALSPRHWLLLAAALVLALVPQTPPAPAQAQAQDSPPFGSDGTVTTAVGSGRDHANAVALQSDGKIVAAGRSHNGTDEDFAVVRYHADGSLDTGFGTGGKVTTDIAGGDDYVRAVTVQSDGKIVAAGYGDGASDEDFVLARYNANGSLDTGFGTDGKVITHIGSGHNRAQAMALQSDGKIVAAGYSLGSTFNDIALARYNPNGSLDTDFGTDGIVTTNVTDEYAHAVAVQPDEKIVVAGFVFDSNVRDFHFVLVRYDSDGSLDTDFGTGGKVTTDITSGHTERGWAVALQSDGKIVVAGETNTGTKDIALARYDSDGSPDTDFGTGGQTTTAIGTGTDTARAVAVQSDGKIVAGGSGTNRFALVRYNSNGTLDTGFGDGGKVTTQFSGRAYAQAMAIQPDGRIVAAGYVFNTNVDFALARYNSDGTLDVPTGNTVSLSASPIRVDEGSPVTVTATLSLALEEDVTIPLVITDDTAEAGDHGTLASITISSGATTGTGTITTRQDSDIRDETFTVSLGTLPSQLEAGSPSSVQITIVDDDLPLPTLPRLPIDTSLQRPASERQPTGEGAGGPFCYIGAGNGTTEYIRYPDGRIEETARADPVIRSMFACD